MSCQCEWNQVPGDSCNCDGIIRRPPTPPATLIRHNTHCKGWCSFEHEPHVFTSECKGWTCVAHNTGRPRPPPVPMPSGGR